MARLCLTEAQGRLLAQYALEAAPREACGLLVGVGEQVQDVIPITNIAADPVHYYRLDDSVLGRTLMQLEKRGQELLAIYHSHPQGEPIPSPTDIRQATFPDTPYVIIGLNAGEPRLAAWLMRSGEVRPVDVYAGPPGTAPEARAEKLSQAQTVAILISAILAFAFMIILSLSLLPPAPVIVTPLP